MRRLQCREGSYNTEDAKTAIVGIFTVFILLSHCLLASQILNGETRLAKLV